MDSPGHPKRRKGREWTEKPESGFKGLKIEGGARNG
jgi:hypothetical protein